jgi:hypothetical protein
MCRTSGTSPHLPPSNRVLAKNYPPYFPNVPDVVRAQTFRREDARSTR